MTNVIPPPASPSRSAPVPLGLLTPAEVQEAHEALERLLGGLSQFDPRPARALGAGCDLPFGAGTSCSKACRGWERPSWSKSLASLLGLEFRRVQFTPDLLPGDIIGSPILEEQHGARRLVFHRGPIFANLVLADEINRATPKTQSALLEAMQEHRVTVLGETHSLPLPFFVLATQNPIELEGTYPLPERNSIASRSRSTSTRCRPERSKRSSPLGSTAAPELAVVVSGLELNRLFDLTDRVHLPAAVANYIARLVSASHPSVPDAPEEVRRFVRFGASPRAAIALAETSRASALLSGRPNVSFDDVRRVATSVLQHRLLLDYAARLENWTPPRLVDRLLEFVPEVARPLPEDLKA